MFASLLKGVRPAPALPGVRPAPALPLALGVLVPFLPDGATLKGVFTLRRDKVAMGVRAVDGPTFSRSMWMLSMVLSFTREHKLGSKRTWSSSFSPHRILALPSLFCIVAMPDADNPILLLFSSPESETFPTNTFVHSGRHKTTSDGLG